MSTHDPFALGPALLFCPGSRPDRFAKAAARADAVILDLEDAVAPGDKQPAREAVVATLGPAAPTAAGAAGVPAARTAAGGGAASTGTVTTAGGAASTSTVTTGGGAASTGTVTTGDGASSTGTVTAASGTEDSGVASPFLDPERTVVRVNAPGTAELDADLAALASTAVRYIMLPKAERIADVDRIVSALPGARVVVLCETARGVLAAPDLAAHPAVVALMWGAEDLIASLGGASSRHAGGGYRDVVRHARSTVLLAARAHGRGAIDAVHTDLADTGGLRAEAEDAAASGFTATACLHPAQVPVVRSAYSPTAGQAEWARRVLAAAARAGGGVFELNGRMVDEPILRHARLLASRSTHEEKP